LEEMQVHQALSEPSHFPEQLVLGGERNPREVDAQKLSVFLPVRGSIEHGVHVVEDVLGTRFLAISSAQLLNKLVIQVGLALAQSLSVE
jgi:hypothetical protein